LERQTIAKVQKSAPRVSHVQRQSVHNLTLNTNPILGLQRSLGNAATQRLISSSLIQTKLQISQPGDPFEKEADQVADTVMRMPDPTVLGEESGKTTEPDKGSLAEVQRVPLAVREDDEEERLAPKLEEEAPTRENEKTIVDTKPIADKPLQRQAKQDEENVKEALPIQAETETTVQRIDHEVVNRLPLIQAAASTSHEENNRDEEGVVSPKLEMTSALEIMPTLHFHKSSDVVQPKCSDESCTEENGKQVDGDTTLQRVPTLNEEEEEKVATKTADTTPESLGSQSNSKDTTTDLPLRRQMREEDEEGVETSQVPIVERQIDAVEQQQAPPRSMHSTVAHPSGSSGSAVLRVCNECEEEQEQDKQQSDATVQREVIDRSTQVDLGNQSAGDIPINRQKKSDDEGVEHEETESRIQRQTEDEEEKLISPVIRRSVRQTTPIQHLPSLSHVLRLCKECQSEKNEEPLVSREPAAAYPPHLQTASSITGTVQSLEGGGRQMSSSSRAFFEPRFGVDFGHVRIHTDARAVEVAKSINARAFTIGRNIAFGAGEYSPDTERGKHVMAHELTHVLQQSSVSTTARNSAESAEVYRLTQEEQKNRAIEVYDLLDGWTSSKDSADILSKFTGLPKSDVNAIINITALHASMSVFDIYKWLHDDMVTSDWKALLKNFITVQAVDVCDIIGYVVVNDYLEGWTSADDSKEVVEYLSGPGGTLLDQVITAMENKAGKKFPDMVTYLFGELQDPDKQTLAQSFFGSGSVKAIEYAVYFYAEKIKDLLAGFTGIRDSASIVQNFQRAGGKDGKDKVSQIAVLTKLNELAQKEFSKSAEQVLMEDMQQEDYNTLQKLLPNNLHVYSIEKNFLAKGWDKIVNGYDYAEGFIEYAVCGVVGVLVGIFDAVVSIVSGIIDIGYGIKNIIGWLISKASGGRFARESEENVNNFFKSMGQALGAPLDLISKMWKATVEEASLIEGPFEECQLAIFWVRRVANIIINILLLIFAGYGAVKAAIEAIEAIKNISSFAEFLAKLGKLPTALLRKLKSLPSSLAAGGRAIVNAIRNVDSIAAAVRRTIGLIRLAAQDESFFLNLRRASGDFIESKINAEKEWWGKRKGPWSASADTEEAKIAKAEELTNTATGEADTNPNAAEQKSTQAEDQAIDAQNKTNSVEKEVKSGQTAEDRAAKQPPGAISPETEAWEKSLSKETQDALRQADPEVQKFWREMDPDVRRALTYCNTPCIPIQANEWPEVIAEIKTVQQRLKIPGDHRGLREYLHMYRTDRKAMSDALKALDSVNSLKDFETFLDNELIKTIKTATGITVRRGSDGLWEFPRADGSVVREFEIGTHNGLTGSRGTENFFQSHHGVQNAWAKERFKGLGVYDEGQAKTLLLRSRNLEGGSRGTPHGIISDLQKQRYASISTRTFEQELAELGKDLDIIGTPGSVKAQYLSEVQQYFRGLYDTLANKMTKDDLTKIFGNWPK